MWKQKFADGVTKLMPPDKIRRFDGSGWCPFEGLSNDTTLRLIHGRTVPLRIFIFLDILDFKTFNFCPAKVMKKKDIFSTFCEYNSYSPVIFLWKPTDFTVKEFVSIHKASTLIKMHHILANKVKVKFHLHVNQ
jgi:hypothetical protein